MSSYAAAHPGYPSLLYVNENALGSYGCAPVAMAPRDVSVITEAKFFSALLCISHSRGDLFSLGSQ